MIDEKTHIDQIFTYNGCLFDVLLLQSVNGKQAYYITKSRPSIMYGIRYAEIHFNDYD